MDVLDEFPFPEPQGFEEDDIPVIDDGMLHPEVEFEAGMSPIPAVSVALIAAIIVVFGIQVARGGLMNLQELRNLGALDPALVHAGEVWRVLSCTFLHANFDHVVGNVIMLYILGMGCEHAFGWAQFLALYVLCGLCGALLSLTGPHVSVGASGAIFGLAGALVSALWRYRSRLHVRDRRIAVLLIGWGVYQFVIGALMPQVDNRAHLGGLACGLVLGLVLRPALLDGRRQVNFAPTSLMGVTLAAIALIGTAIFFVPRLAGS